MPERNVLCHARSIGGGIANAVAKLHPEVNLCNERSFSTLLDVIRIVVYKFFGVFAADVEGVEPQPCSCGLIMRRCAAATVTCLAGAIGWDFQASENWRHVQGMKWLMYHPRDAVIPLEASLFNAVVGDDGPLHALRMPGDIDGHNRPLSDEEKTWLMELVAQALQGSGRGTPNKGTQYHGTGDQHSNGGGGSEMLATTDAGGYGSMMARA